MSKITDDILASVDIVDVVSRHVQLKRSGSNFSGCCPFHSEKTPSFMVSPQKQIFKCFWCGKWGNVFTFVQEYEKIDFWDAVKELAKDARIDITKYDLDTKKMDQNSDSKEKIKRIHKLAQEFFVQELEKNTEAKVYLTEKRKLNPEFIKEFGVGYAPDSHYALGQFIKSKWFNDQDLAEASLIKKGQNTEYYTFFRKRITFPIYDTMNNIIGFSARVLDPNDTPKYINSSEHPAFEKSKILYGLNRAKQNISKHNCIIIVEWQMDVIALHRLGFPIAVATSGTALTEHHMKLLKRYSDNIYFLFDSDQAWQNATIRALNIAYQHDIFPKKIKLPDWYKDADDLANLADWSEQFAKCFEQAEDWFTATFKQLKSNTDITSPIEKQKILNMLFGLVQNIDNISIQQHYIQTISDLINSPFEITRSQYNKYAKIDWAFANRQKNSALKKENHQPSRDILFASLCFNDYYKNHEDHENIWENFIKIKNNIIEFLPDSEVTKLISSKDDEIIQQLYANQMWWENEFDNKDEERKYASVKQILAQTIQWFLQQILKNSHISHEKKQEILTLHKVFSTK